MTDRALSLKQVCQRLGLGMTAVRALFPQLKAYKVGRDWRVDERDLEAFIAARKAAHLPRMTEAQAVAKAFDPDDALPEVAEEYRL